MKKNTTNEEVSKVSALLDFYSDRCVAHASFFVATLFGTFSLLSLLDDKEGLVRIGLASTYWLLFIGSIYLLLSFSYYSGYSEKIQRIVMNYSSHYEDVLRKYGLENFLHVYMLTLWRSGELKKRFYKIRTGVRPDKLYSNYIKKEKGVYHKLAIYFDTESKSNVRKRESNILLFVFHNRFTIISFLYFIIILIPFLMVII